MLYCNVPKPLINLFYMVTTVFKVHSILKRCMVSQLVLGSVSRALQEQRTMQELPFRNEHCTCSTTNLLGMENVILYLIISNSEKCSLHLGCRWHLIALQQNKKWVLYRTYNMVFTTIVACSCLLYALEDVLEYHVCNSVHG